MFLHFAILGSLGHFLILFRYLIIRFRLLLEYAFEISTYVSLLAFLITIQVWDGFKYYLEKDLNLRVHHFYFLFAWLQDAIGNHERFNIPIVSISKFLLQFYPLLLLYLFLYHVLLVLFILVQISIYFPYLIFAFYALLSGFVSFLPLFNKLDQFRFLYFIMDLPNYLINK